MPLSREVYERLRGILDQPFGTCLNLKEINRQFPDVVLETVISIYSAESQYKVIRSNHTHRSHMGDYCARYLQGEDILALCASVDYPPCMMMRRMLETLLHVNKQAIGDVLKSPDLLWSALPSTCEPSRGDHEAPSENLLERVRVDISRCVQADACYSPLSDLAKQAAGLEHEMLLEKHLSDLGIPFWTETDLRAHGYFKTPDVWLQVPIAVLDRAAASGAPPAWKLVHWIDSKATFGDDRIHGKQLEEQYSAYINRYGPGLVIYWFGCLDCLGQGDVMVLDRFPLTEELCTLDKQLL